MSCLRHCCCCLALTPPLLAFYLQDATPYASRRRYALRLHAIDAMMPLITPRRRGCCYVMLR